MKNYLGVLAIIALAASPALGDLTSRVRLDTSGGNWPSSPYVATVTQGTVGMYGTGSGSFQTFCLEYNETFDAGHTYWARVDTYAYKGGNDYGGPNHDVLDGTNNRDPVSKETASLYNHWLANDRMGYSGVEFQYAIWYLEDERSVAQLQGVGQAGTHALALANWALAHASSSDLESVRVMNLFDDAGATDPRQSQLVSVSVPVPVPAASLLAVIGLGLVGWVRKRMA